MNLKDNYRKDGFVIIKNILSSKDVEKLKNSIKLLKVGLKVPFSNEAWGYGNCVELKEFKVITENSKINSAVKEVLTDTHLFNHLMVNRKPPWIGPEVEYHQEIFNSKTYAPGASIDDLKKNWCQVYIPLHSETADNGGLRIVTNSHLLGELESEDMVNQNYSHKRRLPTKELSRITSDQNCNLIDLNLNIGDCVLFSHFLVHGSPSNGSANERISLVLQARSDKFTPDENVFDLETSYRHYFLLNSLEGKVSEMTSKGAAWYSGFKKSISENKSPK